MEKLIIKQMESDINENDIVNFESTFKLELPSNYRSFLLKYNGGIVKNNGLKVCLFLSLMHGQMVEDEIDAHQITEQNIPENYLPIALDWTDNPITINLNKGADYGKIFLFYLDIDAEPDILANTLEEFLGVSSIDEL